MTAYVAPGYTAAAAITAFVGQQAVNHFTATNMSDNQVEQTRIEASARVTQTEIKERGKAFRQAIEAEAIAEYGGGDRSLGYGDRRMIKDAYDSDSE